VVRQVPASSPVLSPQPASARPSLAAVPWAVTVPATSAGPVAASFTPGAAYGATYAPATASFQAAATPMAPTAVTAVRAEVPAGAHPLASAWRQPLPPPKPPPSLLDGFPEPASVEAQKADYERSLDQQLQHSTALLEQKHKATLDFIRAKNEQQKRHSAAAIDHQMMQSELELQTKYNEQMMLLSQVAMQRKLELEKQASTLTVEYTVRKEKDQLMMDDYTLHARYFEATTRTDVPAGIEGPPFPGPARATGSSASPPPLRHASPEAAPMAHPGLEPVDRTGRPAMLYLIVHAGHGLRNTGTGVLVAARVGRQEHRTPVSAALDAYWSQDNHFTFHVDGDDILELEVTSSDGFESGRFGTTRVDLRSLPPSQWLRRREALAAGDGGELEFDVRLEPQ